MLVECINEKTFFIIFYYQVTTCIMALYYLTRQKYNDFKYLVVIGQDAFLGGIFSKLILHPQLSFHMLCTEDHSLSS
jgi:hypothetical protein